MKGIKPMKKSITTLKSIHIRRRAGRPPSILLQVFTTIRAINISSASPILILTMERRSIRCFFALTQGGIV
ncbi:hypothetical protein ACKS0A_02294 [Histoplasma ohiense]